PGGVGPRRRAGQVGPDAREQIKRPAQQESSARAFPGQLDAVKLQAELVRKCEQIMCECNSPDVLTEWTGYVGTEHHMCCGTTESVARDAEGNVINLTALHSLYDQ